MKLADACCMGCRQPYAKGALVLQADLELCLTCFEGLGGKDGVVAFARRIEPELRDFRSRLVRVQLAHAFIELKTEAQA